MQKAQPAKTPFDLLHFGGQFVRSRTKHGKPFNLLGCLCAAAARRRPALPHFWTLRSEKCAGSFPSLWTFRSATAEATMLSGRESGGAAGALSDVCITASCALRRHNGRRATGWRRSRSCHPRCESVAGTAGPEGMRILPRLAVLIVLNRCCRYVVSDSFRPHN
jgi:hypothetical protein